MRRIINTMKYGSAKTKVILLSAIVSFVGIPACIVCFLIWREVLLLFGAIVCIFLTLSLVQTFNIRQEFTAQADRAEEPEKTGKEKRHKKAEKPEKTEKKKKHKKAEKPEQAGKSEKTEKKKKHKKAEKPEKTEKKKKHKKAEKPEQAGKPEKPERHKKTAKPDSEGHEALSDTSEAHEAQENLSVQIIKPLTDETITGYDRKKIRKTMHRYKVKRDHRLLLIDHSETLHISQTPAYIWLEGKYVHLLLIEQEPRHIEIPRYKFSAITYLKKQMVNEDMDYAAFQGKSILAEIFRPYLPDYAHSTVVDDLSAYKNLYGIGDIFVTNRSASALFDLLGLDFQVDDRVTMSNKVNLFFKDAYKANILLRDNVVDANGYADRISSILDNMAHSTISYAEFKDTLNLMIRNKLITQEFAMYYMGVRDDLTK